LPPLPLFANTGREAVISAIGFSDFDDILPKARKLPVAWTSKTSPIARLIHKKAPRCKCGKWLASELSAPKKRGQSYAEQVALRSAFSRLNCLSERMQATFGWSCPEI